VLVWQFSHLLDKQDRGMRFCEFLFLPLVALFAWRPGVEVRKGVDTRIILRQSLKTAMIGVPIWAIFYIGFLAMIVGYV